jgi:predicted DNA-binding transcriptional regulator AlpA
VTQEKSVFDTAGAADYLGLDPRTLEHYRAHSRGPAYVRIEGRLVRYRKAELDAYLEARLVVPRRSR